MEDPGSIPCSITVFLPGFRPSLLCSGLQEEATCPVCLEYFTEPVTLECGHNFCRACISQCWEGSDTATSCPQCRETVQQRNLRPNRQLLRNIVEAARELKLQTGREPEPERLCEKHKEPLKLFFRRGPG
uniref:RING-type domain-containing protein n=1 Tax=Terrapene triunguis TaxID=2587831 RepID=A0A674I997_9SAUR